MPEKTHERILYLQKRTQVTTPCSPRESAGPASLYLQEIRYALAAQLLESTSLTIGEICEKIGIRDPFHFSREFKRCHERSPSLYRKGRPGTAKM